MLPAPSTTETSTPRSRTPLSCLAIPATVSASVPNSRSPIRASPESFTRTRSKAGFLRHAPTWKRANRRITTFSPVVPASSTRSCSIVLPSYLSG